MQADAIKRFSEALQGRLTAAGIAAVYVGPLDDADAQNADLVLFLYRVAVNADLRNAEHRVPGNTPADPPIVYRGSLPLDLYYLLTVGTATTAGEPESLGVLGRALQILSAAPEFSGASLRGETVRVSLETMSSEEMSRIWTLFPTANYRTSVVYLATPVWIDPGVPLVEAAPVVEETYRFGHLQTSEVL